MESFYFGKGDYLVKPVVLKSSPGGCHWCDCSAIYYSDNVWPENVKFKGLFFFNFSSVCGGEKSLFLWSTTELETNYEGHVCALICLMGWRTSMWSVFLFGWLSINGRNSNYLLLNNRVSPFKCAPFFLGVRRSKDPTRSSQTTLDSTAAPIETINVFNSLAITLDNWNMLCFCVLCILGHIKSLSSICQLAKEK